MIPHCFIKTHSGGIRETVLYHVARSGAAGVSSYKCVDDGEVAGLFGWVTNGMCELTSQMTMPSNKGLVVMGYVTIHAMCLLPSSGRGFARWHINKGACLQSRRVVSSGSSVVRVPSQESSSFGKQKARHHRGHVTSYRGRANIRRHV